MFSSLKADALIATDLANLGYVYVNIGIHPHDLYVLFPFTTWFCIILNNFFSNQVIVGRLKNEIQRSF